LKAPIGAFFDLDIHILAIFSVILGLLL